MSKYQAKVFNKLLSNLSTAMYGLQDAYITPGYQMNHVDFDSVKRNVRGLSIYNDKPDTIHKNFCPLYLQLLEEMHGYEFVACVNFTAGALVLTGNELSFLITGGNDASEAATATFLNECAENPPSSLINKNIAFGRHHGEFHSFKLVCEIVMTGFTNS